MNPDLIIPPERLKNIGYVGGKRKSICAEKKRYFICLYS